MQGVGEVVLGCGKQQLRHRPCTVEVFAERRFEQHFRIEKLIGIIVDQDARQLLRGDAVGECRCDQTAGTDTDEDVGMVEIQPFDRLCERHAGADFINPAERTAASQCYANSGQVVFP